MVRLVFFVLQKTFNASHSVTEQAHTDMHVFREREKD